jgi:hypothetical protein
MCNFKVTGRTNIPLSLSFWNGVDEVFTAVKIRLAVLTGCDLDVSNCRVKMEAAKSSETLV